MSHSHIPQLRMHRRRAGLLQKDVAFLLGTTSATKIGRHEHGQRPPSVQNLVAYEILFGISPEHVLGARYELIAKCVRKRAQTLLRQLETASNASPRVAAQAFLRRVAGGRAGSQPFQEA